NFAVGIVVASDRISLFTCSRISSFASGRLLPLVLALLVFYCDL
ncbi:25131_t:CDS:2, partial [Racocetra persica]